MPYADPVMKRDYQNRWMRQRRTAWITEHGPCVRCGSSDDLQVDHIDPKQKTMQPARIWSLSAEKQAAELAKCQVLCGPCHAVKTAADKLTDHGLARYGRGCRCEDCRAAKRDQMRRLRAGWGGQRAPVGT